MESDAFRRDFPTRALAEALGLAFIDLGAYRISGGLLAKVPIEIVRAFRWVPLIFNARRIVLVVDDPFVALTTQPHDVRRLLKAPDREVGFALASPEELRALIEDRYIARG